MIRETAPGRNLAQQVVPEDQDDEVLAALGDTESFVTLYHRYLRPVYAYLYARLRNAQEAEDVTAVAFERAWKSLPGYRPSGSFKAWLFTIANRALADYYRNRDPQPSRVDDFANTFADPAAGPEEAAITSDSLREVFGILAELGEEQQEVISLRFMADLRHTDIAEIMGKSDAAVKMIAYRALEEIRRRCADEQQ